MSAVAGVLRLDGAGVGPDALAAVRAMAQTMSHRGAVSGEGADRDLAWAWRRRPESLLGDSAWPVTSLDGRVRLIHDGRIDNRDDILRAQNVRASSGDGELFAEIIARRGEPGLATLCGDFALAAWFPRDRRLLLVRDPLAVRSLYWAQEGPWLWWASELQAMLEAPWFRFRVCEGFLAEYLSGKPTSRDETPYEGVKRLPQAHALVACDGAVRVAPYYRPPVDERSDLSDDDQAERLAAALRAAVAPAMSAADTLGFQLSGGLDSSSLVGVARAIGGPGAPLRTYSLVYPGLPAADESRYIDAMASYAGATNCAIDPRGASSDVYLAHVRRHRDWPDTENGEPLLSPLYRRARADGLGVLVTGLAGDHWLAGHYFSLATALRRGHVGRAFAEARWRHREYENSWPELLAAGLLPNIPARIKRLLRGPADATRRARWLPGAFARRVQLADRLRIPALGEDPRLPPSTIESLRLFWSGYRTYHFDRLARSAEWHGLELRHPFLDRRVVEVTMTLPDDQRWRDGRTKEVLRRAVGALLPPIVRDRADKGDVTELAAGAIEAIDPERWLTRSLLADAGWIDLPVIREMLGDVRARRANADRRVGVIEPLLNVMGAEAWLRQETGAS